jgi:hypothetical protein
MAAGGGGGGWGLENFLYLILYSHMQNSSVKDRIAFI